MTKYPVNEIESLFERVHPVLGNNQKCATGEHYKTYALAGYNKEELWEQLLNTFRILSSACVPMKPEGCPVPYYNELPKKYLYWRYKPAIEVNQENPLMFTIYCRACVSEKWVEEGQEI